MNNEDDLGSIFQLIEIPRECLMAICAHLEFSEVLKASQACRLLRNVILEDATAAVAPPYLKEDPPQRGKKRKQADLTPTLFAWTGVAMQTWRKQKNCSYSLYPRTIGIEIAIALKVQRIIKETRKSSACPIGASVSFPTAMGLLVDPSRTCSMRTFDQGHRSTSKAMTSSFKDLAVDHVIIPLAPVRPSDKIGSISAHLPFVLAFCTKTTNTPRSLQVALFGLDASQAANEYGSDRTRRLACDYIVAQLLAVPWSEASRWSRGLRVKGIPLARPRDVCAAFVGDPHVQESMRESRLAFQNDASPSCCTVTDSLRIAAGIFSPSQPQQASAGFFCLLTVPSYHSPGFLSSWGGMRGLESFEMIEPMPNMPACVESCVRRVSEDAIPKLPERTEEVIAQQFPRLFLNSAKSCPLSHSGISKLTPFPRYVEAILSEDRSEELHAASSESSKALVDDTWAPAGKKVRTLEVGDALG